MCGIFGIINKKDSEFDSVTFNLLGFHNDSRGGDSCGVFIDGKVEYGTDKLKLYQNFYSKSELLKQTKSCRIALGHCRKASVGGVSPEKAQPVVIYDSEDKEKINFVLIHNGTIKNYSELAKEYIPEIDTKNMTDSQIIANIIYKCGTDVFGEYTGAGVFVFVDYRSGNPEVYVFKGESKEYYSSQTTSEERPLCFVADDDKFIFSSLPTFLRPLQPNLTVYDIPTNKLMHIENCKLFTVKEFDRKDKNMSGYMPSKSFGTYPSQQIPFDDDDYDEYWPDGYDYGYRGGYYNQQQQKSKTKSWATGKEEKQEKIKGLLDSQGAPVILADRILVDNDFLFRHKNRQLCHGRVVVDEMGYVRNVKSVGAYELWFFNGVLLYSKSFYKTLMKEKINKKKPTFDFAEDNFILINAYSPYPFTINDEFDKEKDYYKSEDGETFQPFSGQVPIPFTTLLGCYFDGKSTGNVYLSEKDAFNRLLALLENDNESD